jgi:hypothetical protein
MFPSSRIVGFLAGIVVVVLFAPSLAHAVGSTPVNIVNPADIAKAQGIQQPFHAQFGCSADGGFGIRCHGTVVVPAGQRWVIEYISANCKIDNTQQTMSQAWIATVIGPSQTVHFLTIPDRVGAKGDSGDGVNVVQLGQLVRLYAEAGTTIQFSAGMSVHTDFEGYPFCDISLSGQAVSVP